MNLIYLDVDYVLNYRLWIAENHILFDSCMDMQIDTLPRLSEFPADGVCPRYYNSPLCLRKLQKMIKASPHEWGFVLSSTWRRYPSWEEQLIQELRHFDIENEIVGRTPHKMSSNRGDEIYLHLRSLDTQPERVCILDDDPEVGSRLSPWWIQTEPEKGLLGILDLNQRFVNLPLWDPSALE